MTPTRTHYLEAASILERRYNGPFANRQARIAELAAQLANPEEDHVAWKRQCKEASRRMARHRQLARVQIGETKYYTVRAAKREHAWALHCFAMFKATRPQIERAA